MMGSAPATAMDDGRFLRQEVETESEKHKKPQIPKNKKQIDKTNKKRKAN
jgi:hypothetical protein